MLLLNYSLSLCSLLSPQFQSNTPFRADFQLAKYLSACQTMIIRKNKHTNLEELTPRKEVASIANHRFKIVFGFSDAHFSSC